MEVPGFQDIYDKVQELKQIVVCERKAFPSHLQQLATYPSSPQELPKEIYDYCYGGGDGPVTVEIPVTLRTVHTPLFQDLVIWT